MKEMLQFRNEKISRVQPLRDRKDYQRKGLNRRFLEREKVNDL